MTAYRLIPLVKAAIPNPQVNIGFHNLKMSKWTPHTLQYYLPVSRCRKLAHTLHFHTHFLCLSLSLTHTIQQTQHKQHNTLLHTPKYGWRIIWSFWHRRFHNRWNHQSSTRCYSSTTNLRHQLFFFLPFRSSHPPRMPFSKAQIFPC